MSIVRNERLLSHPTAKFGEKCRDDNLDLAALNEDGSTGRRAIKSFDSDCYESVLPRDLSFGKPKNALKEAVAISEVILNSLNDIISKTADTNPSKDNIPEPITVSD